MSKFSVKKPLTIFVMVIAVLVLGVVAYFRMTPDLFPNMDFPYIMIMTTDPGASPEEVEQEISKPMEQSMSTLEHIRQVTSTSSENYSMLLLQFDEDVNMDTIGVDIQQRLQTLQTAWPETVSAPYVLKINPSIIPSEIAAVSMDGMDTVELTEFVNDTLMNQLEGTTGVARITTYGAIKKEIHVILDQKKIDSLNQSIADQINGKMEESRTELEEQKEELESAKAQLSSAQSQLNEGKETFASQIAEAESELNSQQTAITVSLSDIGDQLIQLETAEAQVDTTLDVLYALQNGIQTLDEGIKEAETSVENLRQIQEALQTLRDLQETFEAEIESIRNDSSLSQEEIEKQIDTIMSSQEYQQMLAQQETLRAQLEALGLSEETLDSAVTQAEESLNGLEDQLESLEETLAEQGYSRETLEEQIQSLEKNKEEIAQGKELLNETKTQLENGMNQLKEGSAQLSQQKLTSLLEMGTAASQLLVNQSSLDAALVQIDGGIDQLESAQEKALNQADLNSIVTMDMVSQILTAQNFSMPAGYVEQEDISYMVTVGEKLTTLEQLQNLVLLDLHMDGISRITLEDVAEIFVTDNSAETYAKLNGTDGVILSFEKQSTTPTAEVTNHIEEKFRALEEKYPGLHFVALMNQGNYIYIIVNSILRSLLLGALFAILILWLFLKDIRPTVITLVSIPISVVFAIVLMYFFNVTINMISLSGLAVAVGMLVDNSVVVIENIYRMRSLGATKYQAAVAGAKQVSGAVIASTLTTICVFLPIVFVEGMTKQLFTDLALTMSFALLASLIVSLTLVPAMASGMLTKEKRRKDLIIGRAVSAYQKIMPRVLRGKAVVFILAILLLVGSYALLINRGFSFMPEMDAPQFNLVLTMPEGASMEETVETADEIEKRILQIDKIESCGAMMQTGGLLGGSGQAGSQDEFRVSFYVQLRDQSGKGSEVAAEILENCKDLNVDLKQEQNMMSVSALTGSGIAVNLYGEEMEDLRKAAQSTATMLGSIPGVSNTSDGLEESAPALLIKIGRNSAISKGTTVAQVFMSIRSAIQDETTAMTLEIDGVTANVIIEKPEGSRITRDELNNLELTSTSQEGTESEQYHLYDIATIEETESLASIQRVDQRRMIQVTGEIEEGYNVTKVSQEAEKMMAHVQIPHGVTWEFDGENEEIFSAIQDLLLMLVLGILLVYFVMVAQFQSLKSPFIVMFTIPLAFTGGFLGLLLCGMEISVVSLIGFVMLTGLIVNNGIVLVDYINQLRKGGVDRTQAIVQAGAVRMRPILMTSITTILGLLDLALSGSVGTSLMQPIAVTCIGGLIYATLMTLFVIPCLYDLMNKKELRNIREEELEFKDAENFEGLL